MAEETKNKIKNPTFLSHIHIKKRIEIRKGLARQKEILKKQNDLLKELYLLPNEHHLTAIDKFLKGGISWESLEETARRTRERYKEILWSKLK